jgi:hypothetical protein
VRIRRRIINTDLEGRVLSERTEEVADDGRGNVEETQITGFHNCPSCGRPIEKVQDVRGQCVQCGQQCCATCEGFCAICHRPLCRNCRLGFAEKGLSVCDVCLRLLDERLAQQDRLVEDKVAFERLMNIYGALTKVLPPPPCENGSIMGAVAQIVQWRVAGKLSRMAKQLTEGSDHGRRLLP